MPPGFFLQLGFCPRWSWAHRSTLWLGWGGPARPQALSRAVRRVGLTSHLPHSHEGRHPLMGAQCQAVFSPPRWCLRWVSPPPFANTFWGESREIEAALPPHARAGLGSRLPGEASTGLTPSVLGQLLGVACLGLQNSRALGLEGSEEAPLRAFCRGWFCSRGRGSRPDPPGPHMMRHTGPGMFWAAGPPLPWVLCYLVWETPAQHPDPFQLHFLLRLDNSKRCWKL